MWPHAVRVAAVLCPMPDLLLCAFRRCGGPTSADWGRLRIARLRVRRMAVASVWLVLALATATLTAAVGTPLESPPSVLAQVPENLAGGQPRALGSTPGFASGLRPGLRAQQSERGGRGHPQVVMFSATWCTACARAKRYFAARRIPYRAYEIDLDPAGQAAFERLNGRAVPLILMGERRMEGFSPARFSSRYSRWVAARS